MMIGCVWWLPWYFYHAICVIGNNSMYIINVYRLTLSIYVKYWYFQKGKSNHNLWFFLERKYFIKFVFTTQKLYLKHLCNININSEYLQIEIFKVWRVESTKKKSTISIPNRFNALRRFLLESRIYLTRLRLYWDHCYTYLGPTRMTIVSNWTNIYK